MELNNPFCSFLFIKFLLLPSFFRLASPKTGGFPNWQDAKLPDLRILSTLSIYVYSRAGTDEMERRSVIICTGVRERKRKPPIPNSDPDYDHEQHKHNPILLDVIYCCLHFSLRCNMPT
jgi:hypothetical protein